MRLVVSGDNLSENRSDDIICDIREHGNVLFDLYNVGPDL